LTHPHSINRRDDGIAALQDLPEGRKVRIVEVGSGSGGTSVVVMAAVADLGDRVELTYTDLSQQLIAYGQKTYGKQYPFVVFKQLDVEKSVEDQVRYTQSHIVSV